MPLWALIGNSMEKLKQGYKQTDIGVIPEAWEVKKLGQLCFPSKSRINPITSTINYKCIELEHLSQNSGVILGYANSKDLLSQKSVFEKGDVLFGKLRPYLKKYWFAEFNGVCTSEIWVLKATNFILNLFLFHLVQSERIIESANLSTGTKMPRAEWKTVAETEIPFPPTQSEQTAIATALSDVDALIAALDKKITKKQQIKQGAMLQLLTGRKRLPGFSGAWVEKKLGEIAEIKDGTHQTPHYVNDGMPFYSVESVTNNDFKKVKTISIEEHKLLTKSFKIEKGDVLMTRIGSIGVCKFVDWDLDASFYVSLALLKFKQEFSAQYFTQYSKTSEFNKEIEEHSLQHATPKKINLGKISLVKIRIPLSFTEQTAIAQTLTDMDDEISQLEADQNKYEQIKAGMMQQLLTGKIRLVN